MRELTVFADGQEVGRGCRIRLSGKIRPGLCPDLLRLEIVQPSDSAWNALKGAKRITVTSGGTPLAAGEKACAALESRPLRETYINVAVVGFAPGLAFWQARVSLTVPAGTGASETVRQILLASRSGVALLAFPEKDPVFARAQAFHGRAAEAVDAVLSAAGAKGALVAAGLIASTPKNLPPAWVYDLDTAAGPWRIGKENAV